MTKDSIEELKITLEKISKKSDEMSKLIDTLLVISKVKNVPVTFENLKMKNPKTYEKYEKDAMKLWGDEIRESLLAEQILEEKIIELIQNRMEAGEQITQ